MKAQHAPRPRQRIFGILALVPFAVFLINLLMARLATSGVVKLPHLPALAEFLILLSSAAMLVGYTTSLDKAADHAPSEERPPRAGNLVLHAATERGATSTPPRCVQPTGVRHD